MRSSLKRKDKEPPVPPRNIPVELLVGMKFDGVFVRAGSVVHMTQADAADYFALDRARPAQGKG